MFKFKANQMPFLDEAHSVVFIDTTKLRSITRDIYQNLTIVTWNEKVDGSNEYARDVYEISHQQHNYLISKVKEVSKAMALELASGKTPTLGPTFHIFLDFIDA